MPRKKKPTQPIGTTVPQKVENGSKSPAKASVGNREDRFLREGTVVTIVAEGLKRDTALVRSAIEFLRDNAMLGIPAGEREAVMQRWKEWDAAHHNDFPKITWHEVLPAPNTLPGSHDYGMLVRVPVIEGIYEPSLPQGQVCVRRVAPVLDYCQDITAWCLAVEGHVKSSEPGIKWQNIDKALSPENVRRLEDGRGFIKGAVRTVRDTRTLARAWQTLLGRVAVSQEDRILLGLLVGSAYQLGTSVHAWEIERYLEAVIQGRRMHKTGEGKQQKSGPTKRNQRAAFAQAMALRFPYDTSKKNWTKVYLPELAQKCEAVCRENPDARKWCAGNVAFKLARLSGYLKKGTMPQAMVDQAAALIGVQ